MLGTSISTAPAKAATITIPARTVIVNHTHVLRKVVRGHVVTLKSGTRVIRVPLVVIHNLKCHPTRHHHCVRRVIVPAHSIPLRATTAPVAAVAVAAPLVPVTVTITDTQVVTLPVETVTNTTTETSTPDPVTVTVTVSVPVGDTG
jgi:hypothetical protein